MANYYVSSTGDNSNDGLSPATAWQDLGYAYQTVTNAFPNNIYIVDDVNLTVSLITSNTPKANISLFSNDFTRKKINVIHDGSAGARQFTVNKITMLLEFFNTELSVTGSSSFSLNISGNVYSSKFDIKHTSGTLLTNFDGIYTNCEFTTLNNARLRTLTSTYNNCHFNEVQFFNSSSTIANMLLKNCTLENCNDNGNTTRIFGFRFSAKLDNCSIQLQSNQALFEGQSEAFMSMSSIVNSVIESSFNSRIFSGNFDMEDFVMIENCILYNVLPTNPVYNLSFLNVVTTLETNWKSIDNTSADFMQLTNTSPARGYATYANIDAGALQADPLILFPPTGKVVAGVPFGNGENGDRLGDYETAPENKVELNFEYGDPTAPFLGTLPAPDVVDGNTVLEGTIINGTPGKYKPADKFLYKEGETFGEENGTARIGEAEMKENQHGRIPVVVKTSDGSFISPTFQVPSQNFYLLKNFDVDTQLADTDIPERVGNGNISVLKNDDNEMMYVMVLER